MQTPALPLLSSIVEYLDLHASIAPSRAAVVDGGRTTTYAELRDAVDATAAELARLNVSAGRRVSFAGTPGLSFWICFLATVRVGAVWLGLNPKYSTRELAHVLSDAKPTLVLAQSSADGELSRRLALASAVAGTGDPIECDAGLAGICTALQSAAHAGSVDEQTHALGRLDACLIVYTSGTTGAPKGAVITGRGLVENAWWFARRCGFETGQTLANLPINHIGCVGDVCATSLVLGSGLVFMDHFDARRATELIRQQQVTWLPQVPAQYQLLLSEGGLLNSDLQSVRHLAWGGAAMPRRLIEQFAAAVPDVFNSYGLTECSGTITLSAPGADIDTLADTVGGPVEASRLRIVDGQGEPVHAGDAGEIQIRGPHVFAGYFNNLEATRDAFAEGGWLRTGDLGAMVDGNVRLIGRNTDMFKSGGYNVYPREVESVIERLPGVELCAVVGIRDDLWGEVGVAFVKADPTFVTQERLLTWCADHLARFKVPKRVLIRDSLPLLPVGKVDRQSLRAGLDP